MVSAILAQLQGLSTATLVALVPGLLILSYLLSYLIDTHGIRSIPGPFYAKFTDIWLGWVTGHGHRSEIVHEMHEKYGMSSEPCSKSHVLQPY